MSNKVKFLIDNASGEKMRAFNVTDIILYPARAKNNSKVAAYVSIILSGVMRIYGIKVINGNYGPYVSWPKYRTEDGKEYKPILFLNSTTKTEINTLILDEFAKGNFTIKKNTMETGIPS